MLRCFRVIQMRRVKTDLCRCAGDCGMDRGTGNLFFWLWFLPNALELPLIFRNMLSKKVTGII